MHKETHHETKAEDGAPDEDMKATRKEEMKENIIAIAIVLVVAVSISWWVYHAITAAPASSSQDQQRVNIDIGVAPMLGNENASITVVEFSDFECPYCGQFARESFPQIKKDYIDTGKIRFVFKNFPLTQIHSHAEAAAEAGSCAQDQNKFWEYYDLVYANQEKLEIADLEADAKQLGLDTKTFNSCLETGLRQSDVAADVIEGQKAGVAGTPTFFFNGRMVTGAKSAEDFGKEVLAEMK